MSEQRNYDGQTYGEFVKAVNDILIPKMGAHFEILYEMDRIDYRASFESDEPAADCASMVLYDHGYIKPWEEE